MEVVVPMAISVGAALVARYLGDGSTNHIRKMYSNDDKNSIKFQEIVKKLEEVKGTYKIIRDKGHSLCCLTSLPSNLLDELARFPYEIEDLTVDIVNGEKNLGNILQTMEDLLRGLLEIKQANMKQESSSSSSSSSKKQTNKQEKGSLARECMRVKDKEAIVGELKNSGALGVAIIGIGGIGKKALAEAIADEQSIKSHFHCVTLPFESSEHSLQNAIESLNLSQLDKEKRVLILLHGLQSVDSEDWSNFRSHLQNLNSKNKVLITSQNPQIADMTSCTKHFLRSLPDDECFSLILSCAEANKNLSAHNEDIITHNKEELIEKCKGLPLLAYHMGLLLSVAGQNHRQEVIRDRVLPRSSWEIPELKNVLLNMKLVSLLVEKPHLQRCVAYCSIFPKGYHFGKDNLVILWMAEGFTLFSDKTELTRYLEEKAKEGFEDMLSYSIFETPESLSDEEKVYKIHDLLYELAQHLASKTSHRVYIRESYTPSSELNTGYSNIRHLSLSCDQKISSDNQKIVEVVEKNLNAIKKCMSLRTFLLLDDAGKKIEKNPTFFKKLSHLRVLDLSHTNLTKLWNQELKQLRYLNLSDTPIKELPSLSKSLKLQVVKLKNCKHLRKLPDDLFKLTQLISLQVYMSGLLGMPPSIGRLIELEMLDVFFVGNQEGCRITELKEMKNLKKSLRITMLENVTTELEAQEAKLQDKKRLERLVLEWTPGKKDVKPEDAKKVVEALKPPKNLMQLIIRNYYGYEFPEWIGTAKVCGSLESIHLVHCQACSALPPLGQLRWLKTLCVDGMQKLTHLGHEFFGVGSETGQSGVFPSLESLSLTNLPKLTEWIEMKKGYMPCLRNLVITKCESLVKLPAMGNLASLETLHIQECGQMEELPTLPTSFTTLFIKNSDILKQRCLSRQDSWDKIRGIEVLIDSEPIDTSARHPPALRDAVDALTIIHPNRTC